MQHLFKQRIRIFLFKFILTAIYCLLFNVYPLLAQQTQIYKPNINRVLFVIDVSGSMKEKWSDKAKFQAAKELLYKLIDSVEKKNPNVEFAVRAFGYQTPREQKNCKDSKLIVPFAKSNAEKIRTALEKITPQGMTPIAYSIFQSANDFPADAQSLNSIILITDGNENCEGNPCASAKQLFDKRISLRPFIVGLNAGQKFAEQLKCIGTFLDTKDEASFYNTVGVIIKQTLNTTTAQVNLIDANGNPTITNVPFTLYDHASGKILYNFIHTMNEKGNPDTLFLDPVGIYDLEIHTYPSVKKENIELTPGKHNIIAVDVVKGDLNVNCVTASYGANDAQVLVRPKNNLKNILNVQDFNETGNYLAADYRIEILTTPETIFDTPIISQSGNKIVVANYGTLTITSSENMQASIYFNKKNTLVMVQQMDISKTESCKLQPGEYFLVSKPKSSYNSESTKTQKVLMEEGRQIVLNL